MFVTIALLHLIGFGVFVAFVLPSHYKGLGIGIAGLAYSLGLRHAFDADHISAIDNTTRKLMQDGRRPLSIGYWFSLGPFDDRGHDRRRHGSRREGGLWGGRQRPLSPRAVREHLRHRRLGRVSLSHSLAQHSDSQEYLRRLSGDAPGDYDEGELERQLQSRGLMSRLFGRWMARIHAEWHMYPIGVLFGLGFDTATEVALLATTALLAAQALPFYAILCLPILFTAGMTLMDTVDGLFMNFAYSWAFLNPVRKVYYNVAITGLSVAICLLIGTIELLGLLPRELGALQGGFWSYLRSFDLNRAGFAIVGLFVLFWLGALAYWRIGRVEERWGAGLRGQAATIDAADVSG